MMSNQSIHNTCHPREGRGPSYFIRKWMPAFAGMTSIVLALLGVSLYAADTPPVQKPAGYSETMRVPPTPEAAAAAQKDSKSGRTPYIPPELNEKSLPATNVILPPLYGWSRIVMHDLKMPKDQKLVNECGMKKDMIFHFFVERLREGGVPVVTDDVAKNLLGDIVTVEAVPEIVSQQDQVINCISWVQLKITMEYTFRVPPLMYRRKVPVLLYDDGLMVSSAKSTHNGALINSFVEMALRLRDAWEKQNGSVDAKILN